MRTSSLGRNYSNLGNSLEVGVQFVVTSGTNELILSEFTAFCRRVAQMGFPEIPEEGFENIVKKKRINGPFYCSFCGKSNKEVKHLIIGREFCQCKKEGEAFTAICDECVRLTVELLWETNTEDVKKWIDLMQEKKSD